MSIPPCSSTPEPTDPQPQTSARGTAIVASHGLEPLAVGVGWIVINKPAGLPSVPGRQPELQDCAITRLQVRHPEALTVHRLDMATSGLMVMARGAGAQRALSRAFAQRGVDKVYEALVAGWMADDEGLIDLPLAADWPARPRQKVCWTSGKPSQTAWQVLARTRLHGQDCTRVALRPLTGRSHQLRVHLLSLGHPILGDTLYGVAHPGQPNPTVPRLMLHARALSFDEPSEDTTSHPQPNGAAQRLSFSCPVPF